MTLAVKCIHNLPPHLSYVLHYPTLHKNQNATVTSWSWGSLTLGSIFLTASWRSHLPVANTAMGMSKGKGTSLQTPIVIVVSKTYCDYRYTTGSSQPLHTHQNWFFSEPLTLL